MSSLSNGTSGIYYQDNCWTRIDDMPIWNWNEITETGNLINLFRDPKAKKVSKELIPIWEDLQQQHLNEFGVDNMFLDRVSTMRKLVGLHLKFYDTRDRSLLNLIKIEESRLEGMKNAESMRFYAVLDYVSTHKHTRINPREITVIEWYYALKNMASQNGKNNKRQPDN